MPDMPLASLKQVIKCTMYPFPRIAYEYNPFYKECDKMWDAKQACWSAVVNPSFILISSEGMSDSALVVCCWKMKKAGWASLCCMHDVGTQLCIDTAEIAFIITHLHSYHQQAMQHSCPTCKEIWCNLRTNNREAAIIPYDTHMMRNRHACAWHNRSLCKPTLANLVDQSSTKIFVNQSSTKLADA